MIDAENCQYVHNSTTTFAQASDKLMRLSANRNSIQDIVFSKDVLSARNTTLPELLADQRSLFVLTPSVDRLYGATLRKRIESGLLHPESATMVLKADEATKTIGAVGTVCDKASQFGLERGAPIVALGGGVCLDISGLAAALYRRGVPHIKVPTTLVGLIDAGIGTKNAVNHDGRKSLLGTFCPPAASVLDASFLATLPARHMRNGFAEMVKIAVVTDLSLFELLQRSGREMLLKKFQGADQGTLTAISRSVAAMLRELSLNLFEQHEYRRRVDFGHTFSPFIETTSRHKILHGEAVSIDMAISTQIASILGVLDPASREAILDLLHNAGLPIFWEGINVDGMYASLESIRQHRSGKLHLVIPNQLGGCIFIEDRELDLSILRLAVDQLSKRAALTFPRTILSGQV
ncbi:sedoheptulose 7-phosphate cyclase [Mycolicibacterium neoaurum]|uniref:sedoheptulose 7-phosphate cyclase n=1 Tax=Mycolicibacterium neoaurum TaxID=1795 RepID=UPI001F4CDCDA|nr:sedoheptulose 7-phosphate cyclase [Mycolicibacterium neoaurum]